MQRLLKVTLIIGMGIFLLTRITGQTILFYINDRFVWLTALAAVGFILLGIGYWYRPAGHAHEHSHAHDHPQAQAHDHDHTLSWFSLLILAIPLVLGAAITPKPLGAAALGNREVNINSLTSIAVADADSEAKPGQRNIMDWLIAFQQESNPAAFVGRSVTVTGFVYRDERFAADSFMIGRFIVSCCVADANPVGLIVRTDQAATLEDDQWLAIEGVFELGEFEGQAIPVIRTRSVSLIDPPSQPYLYP